MAKRKTRAKPVRRSNLAAFFRPETIGSALVVVAFLTLLTLLTPTRSAATGKLVEGLRWAFGVGAWLVPVLAGAIGLWLILREMLEGRGLAGRHILGAFIVFLAFEGLAHLALSGAGWNDWAPDQFQAEGGATGWLIGQLLVPVLDVPASIGALAIAAAAGVFLISGTSFGRLRGALLAAVAAARRGQSERKGLPVHLPLPLADGQPVPGGARKGLTWPEWPGRLWQRARALRRQTAPPAGSPFSPSAAAGVADRAIPGTPGPGSGQACSGQILPAAGGKNLGESAPKPQSECGSHDETASQPAGAAVASGPASRPAREGRAMGTPQAPASAGEAGQSWQLPNVSDILEDANELDIQSVDLRQRAIIIEKTLEGFGVPVQVVEINQGPAVTQFGLRPGIIVRKNRKGEETSVRVRVAQIQSLSNDLALALSASPLRIEAPVPGRDVVGVEVPNTQISLVSLRGVMDSEDYRASRGELVFGLGRDVSGQAVVADLARMPHLLIAGATGSGKSVCVNTIITALLLTHTPDNLRFLMIDPKRVELTVYNGIPHLLAPVVVDVERTVPVLQWATQEMERRYKLFAKASVRNIIAHNEKAAAHGETILPYVVILVDELADLMLSAPEDVERHICRLAQMARATGIHLVIATQRPSVDVVTGLIKANFPARIAFAVTSQIDSRVILDTPGAEQLLGRGDMLYMSPDASKLQRLQGCFVADHETQLLVQYWRRVRPPGNERQPPGLQAQTEEPTGGPPQATEGTGAATSPELAGGWKGAVPRPPATDGPPVLPPPWDDLTANADAAAPEDDLYRQASEEVRKTGRASVSLLQRRLRIGYSRAARLIDELEENGVIGPDQGGGHGREVLPEQRD